MLDTFTLQEINNQEAAKLLKSLDGGKSNGEDKIPPKLVSLAANELANTLTTAINCSIRNSRIPNDAKSNSLPFRGGRAKLHSRKELSPS